MYASNKADSHYSLFSVGKMVLKIVVISAVLALSSASVAPAAVVSAPVLAKLSDDTFDPNPSYSFAYDVQDSLTGDSKGHIESRANGIVQGQYNVAEPDGTRRIVDYTADPINGFNALVRKAPLVAAAAAPVAAAAAPVVAAAPVFAARAAPIVAARSAPVVAARAAPVVAAPAAPVAAARVVAQPAPLVAQTARLAAQPVPVVSQAAPVVAARTTLAAPLVAQAAPFVAARSFGVLPAASYVAAPFPYAYI